MNPTYLSSYQSAEHNLLVSIGCEIASAKITSKKLEEITGVNLQVINGLINHKTSSRLFTILNILEPLGKTLEIISLKEEGQTIDKNLSDINKEDLLPYQRKGYEIIASIAHEMKAVRMTQDKLERITGVNRTTIRHILKNRCNPGLSTILRILTALDKTLEIAPSNQSSFKAQKHSFEQNQTAML